MKLPRLRRKPVLETAESASVSPAAPVLQVLIYSNTDLPEQEFRAQTEKLRRVASYDHASRSWYGRSHHGSRKKAVAVDRDVDRCPRIPSAIRALTGSSARHRCWPGASCN